MGAWKQMVSVALVGTAQAKAPPLPPAMSDITLASAENGEAQFLVSAGALALWRRAGFMAAASSAALAAAEPETRPALSRTSANHMRRMLNGDFSAFLPSWLRAVDAAGLRLPFEHLPAALGLAQQRRELRPLIAAVAGRRGEWLAAQNPEWDFAAAETDDVWETGTRDQRAKYLIALRNTDPAAALARMQTTWQSDPADARTAFVGALVNGLSSQDEPFLELALDDRSKEVRRAAAGLLAKLPESGLEKRMIERATPLLLFKPGKLLGKPSLEVTLPPEPDAAALRDGLDPKAFANEKQFGQKASLLLQILAAVPPAHWTRTFNTTPDKLLAAAKKDEFARAIISGWAAATVCSREASWAEALLESPLPMEEWIGVGPEFVNVLPLPRRAAWAAERVRADGLLESKRSVWNQWLPLLLAFGEFPAPLAGILAAELTKISSDGFYWHLRNDAQQLLLRLPAELAAHTTSAWPNDKEGNADLTEFARFRLEALKGLGGLS